MVWAGSLGVKTFPAKDIKKVHVATESGKITISGQAAGDATVEAIKPEKSTGRCELVAVIVGSELRAEARKPKDRSVKDGCDASLVLKVPRGAAVEAFTGSGGVLVENLRGELKVRTGSGAVSLDAIEAPAHVLTGSGAVSARIPLSPYADIRTGSGPVTLIVGKEGSFTAKTGSGAVKVFAPKGSAVRAKLDTGSGKISNQLAASKDAKLKITAATGSGAIALKPN